MTISNDREALRTLVAETLEAFRTNLQTAGPNKRLPPFIRIVVGGETVDQPIDVGRELSSLVVLALQIVLQNLKASSYALVFHVPPAPGTSEGRLISCGGMSGWDTAVAEQFVFDRGSLSVLTTVAGDSDQSRPVALKSIPNLLRKPDLKGLTVEQKNALDDFAMAYTRPLQARLQHQR